RGVAPLPISERVADTPEQGRPTEHRVVERARGALEERRDQLAEVVHDGDGAPLALEGPHEAPRRGVVARAVAGGEDQHAFHGGLMVTSGATGGNPSTRRTPRGHEWSTDRQDRDRHGG